MVNSCLSRLVRQQAEKYGDKVALKYRDYTTATWIPVTWNGFADLVDKTARAFVKLGVEVQENVGVFSQNKPECLYVDFGAFKDRIVTVPLYATSSEAQVHYIVEDAGIRFLFVGEQYQYDVAYRVQSVPKVTIILSISRTFCRWVKKRSVSRKWIQGFLSLLWMIWRIFCTPLVRQVIQRG